MAALTSLATIIIAAFALTVAGIAMIRRNRHRIRGSGTLGHAMQELEGLFVESKSHIVKVDRAEEAEEEEVAGDPPEKE